MGRLSHAAAFTLLLTAMTAHAAPPPAPAYPESRKVDLVEQHFGEAVADPYRWLENDVRGDKEVADWVARENAVTSDYLAKLPGRPCFAHRLRDQTNYERFGPPRQAGKSYF